jgi:hypothetical protein
VADFEQEWWMRRESNPPEEAPEVKEIKDLQA